MHIGEIVHFPTRQGMGTASTWAVSNIYCLWRTGLYSVTTFLRLCYMLVAMSCHLGLIFTIVVTLSAAQFTIEIQKKPKSSIVFSKYPQYQSLLRFRFSTAPAAGRTQISSQIYPDAAQIQIQTRFIFIHPAQSNIARADAAALELGIGGDTELVKGYSYTKEDPAWEIGKGKDLAREMLVGARKDSPPRSNRFSSTLTLNLTELFEFCNTIY
ncbi:hypothetical protein BJ912DRAFT_223169 [Pholiota molesta]|nr:hypothetical protein BJ912DRAFT_223169 [Pholiota molesta]